jgi:hypothetical protein
MKIIREGNMVRTKGFADLGQRELLAAVANPGLASEAEVFLGYVAQYLKSGAALRHGETLAYGYWLTKFIEADDFLETGSIRRTRQSSYLE